MAPLKFLNLDLSGSRNYLLFLICGNKSCSPPLIGRVIINIVRIVNMMNTYCHIILNIKILLILNFNVLFQKLNPTSSIQITEKRHYSTYNRIKTKAFFSRNKYIALGQIL